MIPDADCLGFDEESIYSDLGFAKESCRAYLRSRLFDYWKLPLFAKIIQSFILMQNA